MSVEPYNRTRKHKNRKQPTLLVVVLHCDDLSPCGSGIAQNGRGIQGLDGERVNHTNVLPYRNSLGNCYYRDVH